MLIERAAIDLPPTSEALFGRAGPLVLEIGFGDGGFLAAMARHHVSWNWLGVEVASTSVRRAMRRLGRAECRNVRLYHGRAGFAVRNLVRAGGLHRAYVNFPDPWPKRRHESKRLLVEPFLRLLYSRLEMGGELLLTTDHQQYAAAAAAAAEATGLYEVRRGSAPDEVLRTRYALKWQARQLAIHHLVFTCIAADRAAHAPLERFPVPHAILSGALPSLDAFAKLTHAFAGGHVAIVEVYRELGRDGYVFLAHVDEEDLHQQVLVEARSHALGVMVELKRFGDPLITTGVREAVGCVVGWLEAQGLELRQASY